MGVREKERLELKKRELEALKKITAMTETMKLQLDDLSNEVIQLQTNAGSVAKVMSNWDSVLSSISQASLSLQRYSEEDYKTGLWSDSTIEKRNKENENGSQVPLPEPLIRMRVDRD